MNVAPRVLILTLSFGAGHIRAAEAVAAEYQKQFPEIDLRTIDALENCSIWFRAAYVWTYWALIRYAPRVWKRFFDSRIERRAEQTAPVWMWKNGCRKAFDEIENFQPDLIVACEVGASEIAVIACRDNSAAARIVNVITDYEAEPIWVKPEIAAYSVANEAVKTQLVNWGADEGKVYLCGIPLNADFAEKTHDASQTKARFDLDARPIILLMGGGMGPTAMDKIAAEILKKGKNLNVVALPGKDLKARAALEKLKDSETVKLRVVGWTNEVAPLMRTARLLATKPGGVTLSEAAACAAPLVLFDAIPGPETINAQKFTAAGAAVEASNPFDAARCILELVNDSERLKTMSQNCAALAATNAAREIVRMAAKCLDVSKKENSIYSVPPKKTSRPVLLLTINNGAAHTRAAAAIAAAWRKNNAEIPARVVEVSALMSPLARFTHVSLYLWLVKNAPAVWGKIDAYQKRQTSTSPEWFYRRECRKLFDLVEQIQPFAIIATEVGCGEIAALVKRDLRLKIPLAAVNLDYDADRAWIQPETDLYCLATDLIKTDFLLMGAKAEKIKIWGAPLDADFKRLDDAERLKERRRICEWLELDADEPLILISGGGEGLGRIEAVINRLIFLPVQIVVLTGRNEKLKRRCEKLGFAGRIRVLGWTEKVPQLMRSADLLISKLGLTFYEAMACGLPIIALEPPPGAERIQYNLLQTFGVGLAARSLEEMSKTVGKLLSDRNLLERMRAQTEVLSETRAADKLAEWLREKINA